MKPFPMIPSVLTLVAAAGCQTTPAEWFEGAPTVDAAHLEHVSSADREDIQAARAAESTASDHLSYAKRDFEETKKALNAAEQRFEIARQEVEAAELQVAQAETGTDEAKAEAQEDLEGAQTYRRVAEANFNYLRSVVKARAEDIQLAEIEHDVARARTELIKARAVAKLDRPEAQEIDVQRFQEYLDGLEETRNVAQVDSEAAWSKADLQLATTRERAKILPASFEVEIKEFEPKRYEE